MTQAVRAFLTDCEEAAGHLRRLQAYIECLWYLDDKTRAEMAREIDDCARSLGLKL